jgi:leader peptidase (prepilin peptidase)/N-methyltransferase
MVGSFLNVCIHRMPIGQSIVRPRSHCPHCNYSIPWFLNVPIATWLYLRGKCANCAARISPRYLLIEILTGTLFAGAWIRFGNLSPAVAVVICIVLAAFIVATFIDLEHFIIPDEITLGGVVAGFLFSLLVPQIQGTLSRPEAMRASFWGIAVGGGLVYAILRGGKLLFGRHHIALAAESRVTFSETSLKLPDEEVPYEELFYRKSDAIVLFAKQVELPDRCYWNVAVQLTPEKLTVGEETFNPEEVPNMEVVTDRLTLPREAMGFGDVKFMAAIGAFFGWEAVIFSLMASAVLGSIVGVGAIVLRKSEWSSRIPYGPYIALAAAIYLFLPISLQVQWKQYLGVFPALLSSLKSGR